MGFDSADHEKRGGTARSPQSPDEDMVDESIWVRTIYGVMLMCVGVSAGVIGLNMMTDHTGRIGPLTTEPLVAVGLVLIGVGMVAAGVVLSLTGETPYNGLPFDVDFIPEEPDSRDVEPGNWENLYLAVFLVYSLVFFLPGALIVYESLTVENWLVHGEILLGILFFIIGTVVVDASLMGRDGDVLGLWVNGGIAAVMTVISAYYYRDSMMYGHDPLLWLLILVLSVIGVVATGRAYVELRDTDT